MCRLSKIKKFYSREHFLGCQQSLYGLCKVAIHVLLVRPSDSIAIDIVVFDHVFRVSSCKRCRIRCSPYLQSTKICKFDNEIFVIYRFVLIL